MADVTPQPGPDNAGEIDLDACLDALLGDLSHAVDTVERRNDPVDDGELDLDAAIELGGQLNDDIDVRPVEDPGDDDDDEGPLIASDGGLVETADEKAEEPPSESSPVVSEITDPQDEDHGAPPSDEQHGSVQWGAVDHGEVDDAVTPEDDVIRANKFNSSRSSPLPPNVEVSGDVNELSGDLDDLLEGVEEAPPTDASSEPAPEPETLDPDALEAAADPTSEDAAPIRADEPEPTTDAADAALTGLDDLDRELANLADDTFDGDFQNAGGQAVDAPDLPTAQTDSSSASEGRVEEVAAEDGPTRDSRESTGEAEEGSEQREALATEDDGEGELQGEAVATTPEGETVEESAESAEAVAAESAEPGAKPKGKKPKAEKPAGAKGEAKGKGAAAVGAAALSVAGPAGRWVLELLGRVWGLTSPLLAAVLAGMSKPLEHKSDAVRSAVGWVAVYTLFLAGCVWVYVLVFRQAETPAPKSDAVGLVEAEQTADASGG